MANLASLPPTSLGVDQRISQVYLDVIMHFDCILISQSVSMKICHVAVEYSFPDDEWVSLDWLQEESWIESMGKSYEVNEGLPRGEEYRSVFAMK
ncbi:hypothetical protein TNCV_3004811 [Trichonephila clavipes]|nr:hypothetical protein TNCV_3004811 [Trichonephila clavipes]